MYEGGVRPNGAIRTEGQDCFQQSVSFSKFLRAIEDGVFEYLWGGGTAGASCVWVFVEPGEVCGQVAFS